MFVDNDTIKYGFGDDWRDWVTVDNISIQNKWHHIATTFDGTNYILYVDGQVVDNSSAFEGKNPSQTEPVRFIGKTSFVSGQFLGGIHSSCEFK